MPQKLFALARVFGNIPDDLFSRDYEQMIFRTVARAGMGPKLLVRPPRLPTGTEPLVLSHCGGGCLSGADVSTLAGDGASGAPPASSKSAAGPDAVW